MDCLCGERFTPAYAGNTSEGHAVQFCIRVHPRIRGEYASPCMILLMASGSPPHTRGIREEILDRIAAYRFTPAYAGNTQAALPGR